MQLVLSFRAVLRYSVCRVLTWFLKVAVLTTVLVVLAFQFVVLMVILSVVQ